MPKCLRKKTIDKPGGFRRPLHLVSQRRKGDSCFCGKSGTALGEIAWPMSWQRGVFPLSLVNSVQLGEIFDVQFTTQVAPALLLSEGERSASMPGKILVVDDDPLSLKNISNLLGEEGYRVEVARDGIEALDYLKIDSFDLILTDIFMPRCNGFGLLENAKKLSPHTPVIFMTAYPTSDPQAKAASLGVEAYLVKPLLFEDLLEHIQRVLKKNWLKGA